MENKNIIKGAKNGESWVVCPNCGHKLFKVFEEKPLVLSVSAQNFVDGIPKCNGNGAIEIKCHSCKAIISVGVR